MLKNIITDVDFVIASFPVHIPEDERIVDGVEQLLMMLDS